MPVHVGLDYGTHSTKVLARARGEKKAFIVRLDERPTSEYPAFASPSVVAWVNGGLYFGGRAIEEARRSPQSLVLKDLKIGLLAADTAFPLSTVVGVESAAGASLDLLVAAYLAWALAQVRSVMDARYGRDVARMTVKVAAPMDHWESAALKARYFRILHAAWASAIDAPSHAWPQGIPLSRAVEALAPRLSSGAAMPNEGERRFSIVPETIAPLVSLTQDPRLAPGRYMVVDMGGGTTEVSVDDLGEADSGRRVLCYSDASVRIGGFDYGQGEGARATDLFEKKYKTVWLRGYDKDRGRPALREAWKKLVVLLVGGGARQPAVFDRLRRRSPLFPWGPADTEYEVRWHRPVGIDYGSTRRDEDDAALLAVAHGLSVERWPEHFPPSEIDTRPAVDEREAPPPYWSVR